jgi:hypothetical protein
MDNRIVGSVAGWEYSGCTGSFGMEGDLLCHICQQAGNFRSCIDVSLARGTHSTAYTGTSGTWW